ncbi:MAG: hypothetical protein NZ840_10015 [Anaerolineales bacterium]|nr:hypothetical protein [Anaerolineales bacterium]MDW8162376.1 hypothetical protein [Anaerolineales bacterium]
MIENSRLLGMRIEQLEMRLDQVKELPWSMALQVREVFAHLQEVDALLKDLVTLGVRGEEFDRLFSRARGIEDDLRAVPVYFFSDSREELLKRAEQEKVQRLYQIVQSDLPEIIEILRQADRWKNRFLSLENQVKLAEDELQRVHLLLAHFPEEVDLSAEKRTVEEWRERLMELYQKGRDLPPDKISALAGEISALIHGIQSTQRKLRQGRQKVHQFQRLQNSVAELAVQIQQRLEALARAALRVEWDISGERYRQAFEKFCALQAVPKPYSLTELERYCLEAWALQDVFLELQRHTRGVESNYHLCERIYTSQEIRTYKQWIQEARKLAEEIRPYDPRNFPNRDLVSSFGQQIQEVEAKLEGLKEWIQAEVLLESSLGEVARALEEIYRQVTTLRERISLIDQVYQHLVNLEKENWALLKVARNQFAQVTHLVLAQPLLADKVEKEVIQLDRRFDLCETVFHQRSKDTVLRKQAKLHRLIADLEQAANRWLSIVESDCIRLLDDIEKRVVQLGQIAHFEDPLIDRARELLARGEEFLNLRTARAHMPLDQIVGVMKKVFDAWQESFAVSRQLAEQIESPLSSLYQEFQSLRQNVRAKFLKLESLIPVQRKWPPNSLLLTVERNEIVQLEEKWRNLQDNPGSVIQFIGSLSEMIASHRGLLEKLLQYEQWALQEQSRIERIEAEIYRLDRLWEIQQRRFRQVPEIEGQIQKLRQEVNQELSSLRQYWLTNASRRPPSVDYDIVLRRLIELSRSFANAKVYWINEQGQQEVMDINGQILQKG